MTKYRLPEALGGGEFEEYRHVDGGTEAPVGTVAFLLDGCIFTVGRKLLTEVPPPLPPEPPEDSFITSRFEGQISVWFHGPYDWWKVGAAGQQPPRTWPQIVERCPDWTLLIPDPFAEPVELPWSGTRTEGGRRISVSVDETTPGVPLVRVLDDDEKTWAFRPAKARELARVLWAAADAAEATP